MTFGIHFFPSCAPPQLVKCHLTMFLCHWKMFLEKSGTDSRSSFTCLVEVYVELFAQMFYFVFFWFFFEQIAMNILNSGRFSMGSSSAGMIKKLIGITTNLLAIQWCLELISQNTLLLKQFHHHHHQHASFVLLCFAFCVSIHRVGIR